MHKILPKIVAFATILFAPLVETMAQSPAIFDSILTRSYGGSGTESIGFTIPGWQGSSMGTVDYAGNGAVYLCTSTTSSDGQVRQNRGGEDIWVLKVASNGDTLWSKTFGGSGTERVYRLRTTPDGGCIITGSTLSSDGDFPRGSRTDSDGFLLKLNANGEKEWARTYGGSNGEDFFFDVQPSRRGGYICAGQALSSDGDLQGTNQGLSWIMKINAQGTREWSRATASTTIGGARYNDDTLENFFNVLELQDNTGYIVAGTRGHFIDLNSDDVFLAKYNPSGNLLWRHVYRIRTAQGAIGLAEGTGTNFYLLASTGTTGGLTVLGQQSIGGQYDGLVLQVNAQGIATKAKFIGGSDSEIFTTLRIDSVGNLLVSGMTRSADVDLVNTTPKGGFDFVAMRLNTNLDVLDVARWGGSGSDAAQSIMFSPDHKFVYVAGRTESTDGDVRATWGGRDLYFVKAHYLQPGFNSLRASQATYCVGDTGSVRFGINGFIGGGGQNVQVVLSNQEGNFNGGTILNSGTASKIEFTIPTGSQPSNRYKLMVRAIRDTTIFAVTDSFVVSNTRAPLAAIRVLSGDTLGCAGDTVTLEANVSTGAEPDEYIWNNGLRGKTIRVTGSGLYRVRTQSLGLCPGEESTPLRVAFRNIPPRPAIAYANLRINISVTGTRIQWERDGVIIADTTAPLELPNLPTNAVFRARVLGANGCYSLWSDPITVIIANLPNTLSQIGVNIYPNPSSGVFNVIGFDAPMPFSVVNALGKVVATGTQHPEATLDLQHLAKGLYWFQTQQNGKVFSQALIIK